MGGNRMIKTHPNTASLIVTEDCNFACEYCFETHRQNYMEPETIKHAIDFLFLSGKDVDITFFGGEPLLNIKALKAGLEHGRYMSQKTKRRFNVGIITNGSIYTQEIDDLLRNHLKTHTLSIQLSVDGPEHVQNIYRKTAKKKDSFHLIEKNIPKFKSLFKSPEYQHLNIHGVLGRKNLPFLFESYEYFKNVFKIPRIWFIPTHSESWEKEDVDLYKQELTKIYDDVLKDAKTLNSLTPVHNFSPLDKCLGKPHFTPSPCGAGKSYISITPNGEIYPCHHFYFNDPKKETLLGNIYKGLDYDKKLPFEIYDTKDLSCNLNNTCTAYHCYRCIADNWTQNKSFLGQPKGYRCEMSKIENSLQIKLRKELEDMGLIKQVEPNQKSNNNHTCLCNLGDPKNKKQQDTQENLFAEILYMMTQKLDNIERKLSS